MSETHAVGKNCKRSWLAVPTHTLHYFMKGASVPRLSVECQSTTNWITWRDVLHLDGRCTKGAGLLTKGRTILMIKGKVSPEEDNNNYKAQGNSWRKGSFYCLLSLSFMFFKCIPELRRVKLSSEVYLWVDTSMRLWKCFSLKLLRKPYLGYSL